MYFARVSHCTSCVADGLNIAGALRANTAFVTIEPSTTIALASAGVYVRHVVTYAVVLDTKWNPHPPARVPATLSTPLRTSCFCQGLTSGVTIDDRSTNGHDDWKVGQWNTPLSNEGVDGISSNTPSPDE